ncbi:MULTISPECIES: response regulator transcription factor [Pantoea]|jgi:FixJ family two-component response regulator|uniref:Response regulator n=1 Tax=Pantoea piersonii TaxID=2364647 RepID=A0AAJ5QQU6_9GAMM|nr:MULTISPECIES: response regulator [Pantoea]MDU6431412.1 response regulator [Pantoea sp.]MBZ6384386.1 response regulator [Pantoea piersonii]MBZ6406353.1 response regulator [Pantoea piersonii]MBZ6425099.1 response regulator [Pantoea piersonii]NYB02732.1 response regulator [Pantoea piersonii]
MQLSQRIVVVVDDERSVRNGLTNLLQSEGYLTQAFESAESLLCDEGAMANAALFIIDVQLKGMNGFELFINLTRRLSSPPGILVSGNGDDSMLRYAIDLGAVAFLPKPIEIDTLFEHIRQAFSSRAARQ